MEEIKNRKPYLVVSAITLLISLCVVFPFESNRSSFIEDLGFTFLTLGIAMLLGMYGLMGKYFFKGLLVLLCSAFFGFIAWFFLYPSEWFSVLVAFWAGIPSGIISGLIFILVNFALIRDENRYNLFFKRLISYLLILGIVSILFHKGGDWMFEISEYIKSKRK